MAIQRTWLLFGLSLVVTTSAGYHRNPLLVLATLNKPDTPNTTAGAAAAMSYLHKDDTSSTTTTNTLPHVHTHPMLQVPCSVQLKTDENDAKVTPLATFVDTGAQVSVLSQRAAAQAGVLHMMDRRYAGHALGVGQCRVLGRLPAGCLVFYLHGICVPAPAITVLEHANEGVDLLLGLDFLRDYQAILNLQTEEMLLTTKHAGIVAIPFVRPRAVLQFGGSADDGSDYGYDQRLCNDYTDDSDGDSQDGGLDMSGL